jgi:hypothetical protein
MLDKKPRKNSDRIETAVPIAMPTIAPLAVACKSPMSLCTILHPTSGLLMAARDRLR